MLVRSFSRMYRRVPPTGPDLRAPLNLHPTKAD